MEQYCKVIKFCASRNKSYIIGKLVYLKIKDTLYYIYYNKTKGKGGCKKAIVFYILFRFQYR